MNVSFEYTHTYTAHMQDMRLIRICVHLYIHLLFIHSSRKYDKYSVFFMFRTYLALQWKMYHFTVAFEQKSYLIYRGETENRNCVSHGNIMDFHSYKHNVTSTAQWKEIWYRFHLFSLFSLSLVLTHFQNSRISKTEAKILPSIITHGLCQTPPSPHFYFTE